MLDLVASMGEVADCNQLNPPLFTHFQVHIGTLDICNICLTSFSSVAPGLTL